MSFCGEKKVLSIGGISGSGSVYIFIQLYLLLDLNPHSEWFGNSYSYVHIKMNYTKALNKTSGTGTVEIKVTGCFDGIRYRTLQTICYYLYRICQ
jgi:hypothetical protein